MVPRGQQGRAHGGATLAAWCATRLLLLPPERSAGLSAFVRRSTHCPMAVASDAFVWGVLHARLCITITHVSFPVQLSGIFCRGVAMHVWQSLSVKRSTQQGSRSQLQCSQGNMMCT